MIDHEVVERVEEFGYPREFILTSLENYEMNDASTSYYLLEKEKYHFNLLIWSLFLYFPNETTDLP